MKKGYFNLYLVVVFAVLIFMISSLYYIKAVILNSENELVIIDQFSLDGKLTDMKERKIESGTEGVYHYETRLDASLTDKIDNDALLVIPRLRGSWHKVYFNNQLIGMIGTEGDIRIHLWNAVYKFVIPNNLIREENILRFETYSEYKIGYSDMPMFIGNTSLAHRLYDRLESYYEDFYLVVIGMLVALALMEIFLFTLTHSFDRRYMFFPISILLISVYLLEYTVIGHASMSALMFKKITVLSFHLSAFVVSFAFAKIYNFNWVKGYAAVMLTGSILGAVLSPTLLVYSTFYNIYNLFIITLISTWIYMAFKSYQVTHRIQDYMIFISAIFLVIPTIYDSISLIVFEGRLMRVAVYGIIFYGLAMLMIAMVNYIENQKDIYSEAKLLELERSHLKRALVTDELTGLHNHRHLYELFEKLLEHYKNELHVVMLDIDKFRPINEIKGHTTGDEILKAISSIIVDIVGENGHTFRYGGEEFVIVFHDKDQSVQEVAENIRISVLEDKYLHELSGYLPLTLSIGISEYKKDGLSPRALIMKAEKAVTYAKFRGRNKVVTYKEEIESQMEGNDAIEIKDKLLIDFIYTLSSVIDMKDEYTGKHSEEVARYSMLIAEEMALDDDQKFALRLGGLLHDFGKLSIPDTIIGKSGKLSDEEFIVIKQHPMVGYDIAKHIVDNPLVLQCVKSHHERMDGRGYPEGLIGEDIPLLSRVICVADAYHAMISTRSYRQALGHDYAMSELIKYSGSQFDSDVVEAFSRSMNK